jgi:chloramphenicol 3-O-phosphotransferase
MAVARDTAPEARRVQLDALRRLSGPERLATACAMSDDARAATEAGIRHRHPGWTDHQVQRGLLVLLVGTELARKVDAARLTAG